MLRLSRLVTKTFIWPFCLCCKKWPVKQILARVRLKNKAENRTPIKVQSQKYNHISKANKILTKTKINKFAQSLWFSIRKFVFSELSVIRGQCVLLFYFIYMSPAFCVCNIQDVLQQVLTKFCHFLPKNLNFFCCPFCMTLI